jgi:hypothetical protein
MGKDGRFNLSKSTEDDIKAQEANGNGFKHVGIDRHEGQFLLIILILQSGFPLMTTLLCVSRKEFFIANWYPFVENCLSKFNKVCVF